MTIVVISHGLYGGAVEQEGKSTGFVESYDPSAYKGRGFATFTDDPQRAMKFASPENAYDFMNQVPPELPVRPDGKPNRPIRAFTLEIANIEIPS